MKEMIFFSKGTNIPTKEKEGVNKERNQTTKEGLVTFNKFESLIDTEMQVREELKQSQQQKEVKSS